jgi:AmmeMemoRadiSam system protein B
MATIREPAVAGYFYPASPARLKKDIDNMLSETEFGARFENIIGIVSPHAGIQYSGRTAAFAYNTLKGKDIETAIVISPSHREYFPGVSVYHGDAYRTPLGDVPVNTDMCKRLTENRRLIFRGSEGHRYGEHALEVQLPFLQSVLTNISIVPIVMGDQEERFINELALAISEAADDKTIVVASSDLSHQHHQTEADLLDSVVADRIKEFDYNGLIDALKTGKCEACGGGGIVAMMKFADKKKKRKTEILHRTDSGKITGDPYGVVGYLSAVVYG